MLNDKLYHYRAELLAVTDGDTIKVRVDLGMRLYRDVALRVGDIDTPEIRGEERPQGLLAKQAAMQWLLGKRLVIRTEKDPGSYDRYTAVIYDADTEENFGDYMVKSGYAVPYVYRWS